MDNDTSLREAIEAQTAALEKQTAAMNNLAARGQGARPQFEDKAQAAKLETTDTDIHRAREHTSSTLLHMIREEELGRDENGVPRYGWVEHSPGDKEAIFGFLAAAEKQPKLGQKLTAMERMEQVLAITDSTTGRPAIGSFMKARKSPVIGRNGRQIDKKPRDDERFIALSLRRLGPKGGINRVILRGISNETRRLTYDPHCPVDPGDPKSKTRERISQRAGTGLVGPYTGEYEWLGVEDAADRYEGGKTALTEKYGPKGGWLPIRELIPIRNKDGRNEYLKPGEESDEFTTVAPPVPMHEVHAK